MLGENAVWYGRRGAARVALNRLDDAETDLGARAPLNRGVGEGRA